MKVVLFDKWNDEEFAVCRLREGTLYRKLGVRIVRNQGTFEPCGRTTDGLYDVWLCPVRPCGTFRVTVERVDESSDLV